jgi:hypothetical protein
MYPTQNMDTVVDLLQKRNDFLNDGSKKKKKRLRRFPAVVSKKNNRKHMQTHRSIVPQGDFINLQNIKVCLGRERISKWIVREDGAIRLPLFDPIPQEA